MDPRVNSRSVYHRVNTRVNTGLASFTKSPRDTKRGRKFTRRRAEEWRSRGGGRGKDYGSRGVFNAYPRGREINAGDAGGSACVRAAAREGMIERELTVSCGLRVRHTERRRRRPVSECAVTLGAPPKIPSLKSPYIPHPPSSLLLRPS